MIIDNKKSYRKTEQRKRILEILCSTTSHPTADWIYEQVKRDFPKLSLGTVYRNLRILKAQGLLQELPFGNTFDRFDGNINEHPHFLCKECGAVIDVILKSNGDFSNLLQDIKNFKVEECRIVFSGLCDRCNEDKE